MSAITAQEWEVLGFFEVEPTMLEEGIGWPYNDFLYVVSQGDLSLSCSIAPAYRDVRIILSRDDVRLYELNAVGVKDVRVVTESGRERLEIDVDDRQRIALRIRPHIELTQHARIS